jgi:hypothetical protein
MATRKTKVKSTALVSPAQARRLEKARDVWREKKQYLWGNPQIRQELERLGYTREEVGKITREMNMSLAINAKWVSETVAALLYGYQTAAQRAWGACEAAMVANEGDLAVKWLKVYIACLDGARRLLPKELIVTVKGADNDSEFRGKLFRTLGVDEEEGHATLDKLQAVRDGHELEAVPVFDLED